MNLSNEERLHLQSFVGDISGYKDNTESIRRLKHSVPIRLDVCKIIALCERKDIAETELYALCVQDCPFMHTHYFDIFNRLVKGTLDVVVLYRMLIVLKLIEDGHLDQHEGSVKMGKILKEMFIDSAEREQTLRNQQWSSITKEDGEEDGEPPVTPARNVGKLDFSWKEYKALQENKTECETTL